MSTIYVCGFRFCGMLWYDGFSPIWKPTPERAEAPDIPERADMPEIPEMPVCCLSAT